MGKCPLDFLLAEHDREFLRNPGRHNCGQAVDINPKDVSIEKKDCIERQSLRCRRYLLFHRKKGEKALQILLRKLPTRLLSRERLELGKLGQICLLRP